MKNFEEIAKGASETLVTPTAARTDRLTEIRRRGEAATIGPWERRNKSVHAAHGTCIDAGIYICDAEFIAHARQDIPWLLEQTATLTSALEAARLRAYRTARVFEPSMDGYRGAMATYEAAFGKEPFIDDALEKAEAQIADLTAERDELLQQPYGKMRRVLILRAEAAEAHLAALHAALDQLPDWLDRFRAAVESNSRSADLYMQEVSGLRVWANTLRALRTAPRADEGEQA